MTSTARSRVPEPLVILSGCILLAAAASWILPAGEFDRREDEATGRMVVVAGSYHTVERTPVGPFEAVVALPLGMADAADVIFLVFLIGGAFTVVDASGTLGRATAGLARALSGRDILVIPIVSLFFAVGGATENMAEEIVALVPVLLVLAARVGFTPLVAVAMSAGAASVAAAFSPVNPFQVLVAQGVADVPLRSGWAFRTLFLLIALAAWIGVTMRHAARTRGARQAVDDATGDRLEGRDGVVLALVAATFAIVVWGLAVWGWDFNRLSAAFFIMGVAVGLVSRMGVAGTAAAYARGFRDMAYAAILIGFARAIYVVLDQGHVVDTIVYGMFLPIEGLPRLVSAVGMLVAHAAIHVPVPSVSGQAVLTMPLLVPLSDLLELSRQVTVLAYQYGAGLCDLVTPTNGALMAVLAAAGVRYDRWLAFVLPLYLGLMALGAVAVAVAIAVGLT
ncbi:MAG: YfcC family protein [Gemmatimonadales bacterium]